MNKKTAILTSGGDAPGMNSAIRSFTRRALWEGYEVYGIISGFEGLINEEILKLKSRDVGLIINQGGTFLKTSRSEKFKTKEGLKKAADFLLKKKIGSLCVIGGEGSFSGLLELSRYYDGQLIGIPGTIDNDIPGTEYTIGFQTAVETAVMAVDKIRDTAFSHGRIFFIEVMGRKCGEIALAVALACGAEDVLIPESPTNIDELSERLMKNKESGKRFSIIVVAEGDDAGGAFKIAEKVEKKTGLPHRVAILGHIQRGGPPCAFDRIMALNMGDRAFEFIKKGLNLVFTAVKGGHIEPAYLKQVKVETKSVKEAAVNTVRIMGTI
ncbi:MAG: 6-phosphofructokinase [Spirochaetia bacterium]|nr:6-phosphofructokinase [Spirochaetia bacterium]